MINLKLKNTKPLAATMKEWNQWEKKARAEEPFQFWLHETLPETASDIGRAIVRPYNNLRYWIRYRIFDKYHMINTGLKPNYYDCDTRLLNGMFNLLVDFVEVESAWMHVVFDKEEKKKHKYPWWSIGWTRFKSFRDPQAGLAHLAWEMTLDDPKLSEYERCDSQAVFAREKLALYNWWKITRPARPEPMDASGWSAHCAKLHVEGVGIFDGLEDESPELKAEGNIALNELHRIEKEYDDEDEEMLIRLIKIRKGLWT
jgi:hypothetical protein